MGFYLGPNLVYRHVSEQLDGTLLSQNYPFNAVANNIHLQETGNAIGLGLAWGWKFAWRSIFYEPGFSVEYARAKYPNSAEHQTISNYYNGSDMASINIHLNIGWFYSKGGSEERSSHSEVIPSETLPGFPDYALLTLYFPPTMQRQTSAPDVMINDTIIGKFAPGNIYTRSSVVDSAEMKIAIKGMSSAPLRFYPVLGQQYYLKVLPPKSEKINVPRFQFVKPEVGKYDIKLIKKRTGPNDLRD